MSRGVPSPWCRFTNCSAAASKSRSTSCQCARMSEAGRRSRESLVSDRSLARDDDRKDRLSVSFVYFLIDEHEPAVALTPLKPEPSSIDAAAQVSESKRLARLAQLLASNSDWCLPLDVETNELLRPVGQEISSEHNSIIEDYSVVFPGRGQRQHGRCGQGQILRSCHLRDLLAALCLSNGVTNACR